MSSNTMCILIMGAALYTIILWGCRVLPREHWQIAACIPWQRMATGRWSGFNLTWYGFFTASAYTLGIAVVLVLLSAINIPSWLILSMIMAVLALCVPASRLIATWVEGRKHTFTVGGASFVGMLVAPWVIAVANAGSMRFLNLSMHVPAVLAAFSIAYTMAEGIGRLACISFGCCYGKPLSDVSPLLRTIIGPFSVTFHGSTKKIAYAHGMEGHAVVPVQGMTSLLYTTAGLGGIFLYMKGHYVTAFLLTLIVTQYWRILSEFIRADYRGNQKFSAYQVMAFISVCYGFCLPFLFPGEVTSGQSDIMTSLQSLWHPAVILLFQTLWIAFFLYTGRSTVTACEISIHVLKERI